MIFKFKVGFPLNIIKMPVCGCGYYFTVDSWIGNTNMCRYCFSRTTKTRAEFQRSEWDSFMQMYGTPVTRDNHDKKK